jgi:hypothetical protein
MPRPAGVPARPSDAGEWLTIRSRREQVEFALGLLLFAGIAFLWFIGVIRDRLGDREDRFFATIFLGSGLLFSVYILVSGPRRARRQRDRDVEDGDAA